MAWVPAEDDMALETHIKPIGAAADANNTIRTPEAYARFFSESWKGRSDSLSPNIVDAK